jgi:hypothetical protein
VKVVKITLLAILLAGFIFSLAQLGRQSPILIAKDLASNHRLSGQTNFLLNYLAVIPVAQARMEYLGPEGFRGRKLIHIRAEAKTFDYARSVFHAGAAVDSYVDPKSSKAVYFLQHLEMIGKPDENKEIYYDQKDNIMVSTGSRGTERLAIDKNTFEPLSAFLFIQNLELAAGTEFDLSLNTNQKDYFLSGKCVSRDLVRIGDKNYNILLIEAQVRRKDKSPRHGFTLKIWFLEDGKRKIPLLVRVMTNIGPVVAVAR